MAKQHEVITLFEHGALYTHKGYPTISDKQLNALQLFFKEKDFPYYKLVHNGIKFCEYVGVLQIGNLIIEVLPKVDKTHDASHWRNLLIDMLQSSGVLRFFAPSSSSLKLKSSPVLHLYFDLFLREVEQLLHNGLIKKYRKEEGNMLALKGRLLLSKHITKNVVHKERFYIAHSTYDSDHTINQILLKTLRLLNYINTSRLLSSRIATLLVAFPELQDLKVTEQTFDRIIYNRKNLAYKDALEIARLILLNYHPDVSRGKNDVLALMFDMNLLWEQFVFRSLLKFSPPGFIVQGQSQRHFWRSESGRTKKIIPDIVLENSEGKKTILDTKWKNIDGSLPSDDDLRQMYVYGKYHDDGHTFLIYPGQENSLAAGVFSHESGKQHQSENRCGIVTLKLESGKTDGQKAVSDWVFEMLTNLIPAPPS